MLYPEEPWEGTDNHVLACLDTATSAVSIRVEAGLSHDPDDDANPQTDVNVTIPAAR